MVTSSAKIVSFWEAFFLNFHLKKVRDPILKTFARKVAACDSKRDSLETLVLGSSHAQMGWLAGPNEFNLGMSYQDLYHTYHLYKRYADSRSLKKIVVFYSVFSQGHQLIRTNDAWISATYKVVSNVPWQDSNIATELRLDRLIPSYRRKATTYLSSRMPDFAYNGNECSYVPVITRTAAERATAHFKNSRRAIDMSCFVRQLINDAALRNQVVYVVVPPVTQAYREALPDGNQIFGELTRKVQTYSNGFCFNHYGDRSFSKQDFIDWDHLSRVGAEKLTKLVKKEMENV